jgi:hypothetical protein
MGQGQHIVGDLGPISATFIRNRAHNKISLQVAKILNNGTF